MSEAYSQHPAGHPENDRPSTRAALTCRPVIRTFIGLAVVLGLMGCASVSIDRETSQQQRAVVQDFYDKVMTMNVHGLPTPAELSELEPLMSERLVSLLNQAYSRQAREQTRHKGTEPPLIQGSIFFSLFEGATRLISIEPDDSPNMWAVTLAYSQPDTEAFSWTDEVLLSRESGQWVVDDIDLLGKWDFARTGWVSNALLAAIQEQGQ